MISLGVLSFNINIKDNFALLFEILLLTSLITNNMNIKELMKLV